MFLSPSGLMFDMVDTAARRAAVACADDGAGRVPSPDGTFEMALGGSLRFRVERFSVDTLGAALTQSAKLYEMNYQMYTLRTWARCGACPGGEFETGDVATGMVRRF
jgi:hypothetical protein